MKAFFSSVVLLALAVTPVMAQTQEDFAACVAANGKAYQAARDKLLATAGNAALLKEKKKSASWRERLTARVLEGWTLHEGEYRKLLAVAKVSDQTGAEHYPWATIREGIQSKHIPLMYELMMKDIEPDASDDAALALLALIEREPAPLDVDLLHQFLRAKDGGNAASRKSVAWLIGSLPAKRQNAAELQLTLKAELGRADKDRSITLSLLEGFGRAAKDSSNKQKDKVVQALLSMDALTDVVGKTPLTYALGNIGGDKASEQVIAYLDKSADPIEKLWAVRSLSKCGSEKATDALLAYAEKGEPTLRSEAIAGLGRSDHHLPEVVAKLTAIAARDTKATDAQKTQAFRSLVLLNSSHPGNTDLHKQIQSSIRTISASNPNAQLKQELQDILDNVFKQP